MLGLVVAAPVILAVFFLMVFAWANNEPRLWILVAPLAILGAALTVFAVRALRPALATFLTLAVLGALELVVVIFLLAASRPITGGTITGTVISVLAAGIACWSALRTRASLNLPATTPATGPRKPAPFTITVRKPPSADPGVEPAEHQTPNRRKRKK